MRFGLVRCEFNSGIKPIFCGVHTQSECFDRSKINPAEANGFSIIAPYFRVIARIVDKVWFVSQQQRLSVDFYVSVVLKIR